VGDAQWTIRVTATVQVDTKSVAAWWTHPDRMEEAVARLRTRRFISDLSVEDSLTDSGRIRDIRFKGPRGSLRHIRVETDLDADGCTGTWNSDRFHMVRRGFDEKRSARGLLEGLTNWDATVTLIPTGEDVTEIVGTHNGRAMEAGWFERLTFPIVAQAQARRSVRDLANRCEQEQRTP
jgi:hypothetical protein